MPPPPPPSGIGMLPDKLELVQLERFSGPHTGRFLLAVAGIVCSSKGIVTKVYRQQEKMF